MSNFNKVILVGNLTKDPELRYTPEGTALSKLRLAVNRKWRSREGETKEETCFVNVTAFGRSAELVAKYLEKGNPVLVDGRLRSHRWENDKGEARTDIEVIMEGFQFLPRRRSGGPEGGVFEADEGESMAVGA